MLLALRRRHDFQGVRRLAGASGLLLVGRVAGAAANFVFALSLARILPPAEVGAVFAAISTAFLTSIIVTLNIESGSIRFLVAARQTENEDAVNGFIAFGRRLLFSLSLPVCGAYVFVASLNPDPLHITAILCAAASIPAIGWLRLAGSHATALGKPAHGSLPRTALQPLLLVVLFQTAIFSGVEATADLALFCFLASFALTAVAQFLLLRQYLRPRPETGRRLDGWRDWLANGFYLAPNIMLQDYLQHAIILSAAFILKAEGIAVLGLALRCISLIRFGVLSINIAASPMISRAIAEQDHSRRDAYFRNAALLKAPPALLAMAGIFLLSGPILSIFGPEYADDGAILGWLAFIPLVSALLGPNYMLLNISGARRHVFAASLAALGALFTATPIASAIYGATGAAIAATLVFTGWELSLFLVALMKFGMDASILSILHRK